jgi:hypothetical protein
MVVMRSTRLVIALAAGCSFTGAPMPSTTDAPPGTADAGPDAPPGVFDAAIDAKPPLDAAWCQVETDDGTITTAGQVGASGGGQVGDIGCDNPDDLIVGAAVEMSNQATIFGGRSARGFRIACAPLATIAGGGAVVGTEYTREVRGDGNENWSPSTWSAITYCPAGWAFSGLDTHLAASGNRFIDTSLQCAELDAAGALTGQTMAIYVEGSLDETSNPDGEECGVMGVVRRLTPRTGSGLDALTLRCAQTRCQ